MTLVWLMAITLSGALVRLTGSGLGCTDWPNCTVNTELDAPGFHSAIEFGNRMISGLAIIPVIAGWMAFRKDTRQHLTPWFAAMVIGFLGQVILGMLVTRTELDPRVVIGHFLLSIVLIFIGVVLDYLARVTHTDTPRSGTSLQKRHRLAQVLLLSATSVIVAGTLVTGSGPHTGSEKSGDPIARLGFDIREISRIHSILGWVLVMIIVYGLATNRPSSHESSASDSTVQATDLTWFTRIATLALLQGAIGYLQYATGVPVVLVGVHIAGSVVLWTAVAWYFMVTSHPDLSDKDAHQEPEYAT